MWQSQQGRETEKKGVKKKRKVTERENGRKEGRGPAVKEGLLREG